MKKRKRKKFRHLIQSDRDRLEILLRKKHSQKEIAETLKVDKSTICREVKKRKRRDGAYNAKTAEAKAAVKRSASKRKGMKIESNPDLRKFIISELKNRQSPDAIAGRMKREKLPFSIGKDAIYAWLYTGRGSPYINYLCTKRHTRKLQKKKSKREMIPNRIPLTERPKREGMHHAEGDTFVSGKRANTTASGAMIVVPEAQLMIAKKIPDQKPKTMTETVNVMIATVHVDDLTLDNGIENRDHEHFDLPAYFCEPHHPWEKPHVENAIGLLRRWFLPKGTNLEEVTQCELDRYISILNHKYRKSLGYRSPVEVALQRGIIKNREEF